MDSGHDVVTAELLEIIRQTLRELMLLLEQGIHGEDAVDYLLFKCEWTLAALVRAGSLLFEFEEDLIDTFSRAQVILENYKDHSNHNGSAATTCILTGDSGRPRFLVPKDKLKYLLEEMFTIPEIACLLNISPSTVKRNMKNYDLSVSATYTEIGNEDLVAVIKEILQEFPGCGYKRMIGFLRAKSIRVTEQRVREGMRNADPAGVLQRALQLRIIRRRKYNVPYPNFLWHIDGCHKLIRMENHLQKFKDGWDKHPLSTAAYKSPDQLWRKGNIQKQNGQEDGPTDFDPLYGVDWDGPVPLQRLNNIVIPTISSPLSESQLGLLRSSIDPLDDSMVHGADLYIRTLFFIRDMIHL